MESEKCCCIIPIEMGIRIIALMTILGGVAMGVISYLDEDYL